MLKNGLPCRQAASHLAKSSTCTSSESWHRKLPYKFEKTKRKVCKGMKEMYAFYIHTNAPASADPSAFGLGVPTSLRKCSRSFVHSTMGDVGLVFWH